MVGRLVQGAVDTTCRAMFKLDPDGVYASRGSARHLRYCSPQGHASIRRGLAMREWILALAPIGAIFYFIMYPDQFHAFIDWAERLLFH
jgi:hypothetical protein